MEVDACKKNRKDTKMVYEVKYKYIWNIVHVLLHACEAELNLCFFVKTCGLNSNDIIRISHGGRDVQGKLPDTSRISTADTQLSSATGHKIYI